jgi:hypothetical protein
VVVQHEQRDRPIRDRMQQTITREHPLTAKGGSADGGHAETIGDARA